MNIGSYAVCYTQIQLPDNSPGKEMEDFSSHFLDSWKQFGEWDIIPEKWFQACSPLLILFI